MINFNHVTKRFGRDTAVNDVTLTIEPGDSLALWGSNGAGKTTLIRCALGLLRFRGSISVGAHNVRKHGKAARLLIGYVPQELGFYDDLGVADAISFFARLKGLRRVSQAASLASVGLSGHGSKRIRHLSGGMKQRLALAIALLGDPPVLILDEVTASLDAVGREEFVTLLKSLTGTGRTMLFASHRIDEVATLAHRVATLERGKVTKVLACSDFVSQMRHGAVLHLHVKPAARQQALQSLSNSGFAPQLNGIGLLVPVTPEQKAAPFRVLAEARITIDDFELVSVAHAAAHANQRQEKLP
ncbi:MAG: ABC transporter ATP-binding protein [Phycisphaeraceae bacterium]|nr:ABC transporter ATP-binding protein [Phycisphaeraceae bacterium]MCW5763554.1 ABC transporter ATP-binding protein [Phycisphaeraceae bacterium]